MSNAYPHLFAPFELAGRRLRNRIVHASISLRYAVGQGVSDRLIAYHAQRARGGAAMIVTEPLAVAPHQPPRRVIAWDDSRFDDLTRWAAAVEVHDCRLIGQGQDIGRGRHVPGRSFAASAPSALPDDALAAPLEAAGIALMRIGDCKVARNVLDATAEGYAAGMAL